MYGIFDLIRKMYAARDTDLVNRITCVSMTLASQKANIHFNGGSSESERVSSKATSSASFVVSEKLL